MTDQNKKTFNDLLTELLNREFDCGAHDDPDASKYHAVFARREDAKNALVQFVHQLDQPKP